MEREPNETVKDVSKVDIHGNEGKIAVHHTDFEIEQQAASKVESQRFLRSADEQNPPNLAPQATLCKESRLLGVFSFAVMIKESRRT